MESKFQKNKKNSIIMLKKVVLLFVAALTILACSKVGENEFIIEGEAKGVKNGTMVFLQKQDSTGIVQVDTVKVAEGKFKFEGKTTEPFLHFIQVKDLKGGVPLVLETGEIAVIVDKDTVGKSKVSGTYSNERLAEYAAENDKINKKMAAFQKANMEKYNTARTNNDTVTMNALMKQNDGFRAEFKNLSQTHIDKYPKSYLSLYFLEQFVGQPDTDMVKFTKQFNSLDASLKNTKGAKKIQKKLDAIKATSIGGVAPDFSARNPEGKTVSLKASLGKVTIVDFWASWCKPCREENPNVVALYNEFHPKGLNIIGVSMDSDANAWKEAISKDGLTWTQVANLNPQTDVIAKKYNISNIPATYILDANGKIIAKDLRGAELRAKIASLLGA
jgi:peroxiredoxin